MERREEGGLTETGKEKARSEEERVTFAKARDSFETCAPILLSDDKKKRGLNENVSRDVSLRYILRIYLISTNLD